METPKDYAMQRIREYSLMSHEERMEKKVNQNMLELSYALRELKMFMERSFKSISIEINELLLEVRKHKGEK
jgi:hypothetical protein